MGNKNTQARQQITVGRRQVTPAPLNTPAAKLAARVEVRAKADARVRELEAENAGLRRDGEFHALDKQCEEVLKLNIQARKLGPQEVHRLANELNGAIARHKAAGHSARSFDPYAVIKADAERHGQALRTTPKDANPLESQLPEPRGEGRVTLGDAPSREAAARESQERGARQRADVMRDREAYQRRLRELGLTDPTVGMPGNGNGIGL